MEHVDPARHRRWGRWAVASAAACVVGLLLVACGTTSNPSAPPAGSAGTAPAVPVDYSAPGPYQVGLLALFLGDRDALVFYPADPSSLAAATHVTSYSSGDAFTPEVRQLVAGLVPEFVQDIPLDAYRDARVSPEGPFPLVLHSHGFGGSNRFAQQHLRQLASWGFVVAAPDHKSRNISAVAGGAIGQGPSDTDDLGATLDALVAAAGRAGGPIERAIDLDRIGVEGHSAGGSAAVRFGSDPRIDTIIGQAPAPPVPVSDADRQLSEEERQARVAQLLAAQTPPDKPVLLIAAERDSAIPLPAVQAEFDWLRPPKALAVLAGAGHNAFTDTCAPIRAQGGLEKYAPVLGPAFAPLLRLGGDGCNPGDLDPVAGYRLTNQLSVAWYRYVFGLDASDASLQPAYLQATFPEAFGSMQWCATTCGAAVGPLTVGTTR